MNRQIIKYLGFLLMAFIISGVAMAADQFRTQELKRLADRLKIDTKALNEGYNYPTAQGFVLVVHVKENMVDHLGIKLFPEDIRNLDKSPIFSFLERYFLQLKFPPGDRTTSNILRDDQFKFLKGTLKTIDQLQPTDGFSYDCNNHRYVASWNRNGEEILSVSFPIEYELISGENKIEADNLLAHDVLSAKPDTLAVSGNRIVDDHYITSDFSNRLYYANGTLVLGSRHPAESAANIMLSQKAMGRYQLHITQIAYGFKKNTIDVPIRQWIAFCQNSGCELYFGVESLDDPDFVEAVVLAVNQKENYNHVLTVKIPTEAFDTQEGDIDARLYSYVPTHNVKSLFANYRKSNPKTIVSR